MCADDAQFTLLRFIFSLRDVTERDVPQEQVGRTAIIFDYFANRNQAGGMSSMTGLNWVSLPDNDDCFLPLVKGDYVFKNIFYPKHKLNNDLLFT